MKLGLHTAPPQGVGLRSLPTIGNSGREQVFDAQCAASAGVPRCASTGKNLFFTWRNLAEVGSLAASLSSLEQS